MYYPTSVLARTSSGLENLTSSYLPCPSTLFVNLLDLTAICQSNKHTQSLIMESADSGSCSRHHLSELFYSCLCSHSQVGLSRAQSGALPYFPSSESLPISYQLSHSFALTTRPSRLSSATASLFQEGFLLKCIAFYVRA